jgi:hypothetical protein
VIVIDTSPRLHVWRRITRELIDVLRSSSAFRTTTVWQLAGDQPDVVLRSAGGAMRVGERSLIEAAHRTAMLVISDFADPLWRSAVGLTCLRLWCRHMMVALVSLVPQRSWGRTLLGMLPATRLTSARRAIPSAALASEAAVLADAIPVPVISIDPTSFGTWARLLAGGAHARPAAFCCFRTSAWKRVPATLRRRSGVRATTPTLSLQSWPRRSAPARSSTHPVTRANGSSGFAAPIVPRSSSSLRH